MIQDTKSVQTLQKQVERNTWIKSWNGFFSTKWKFISSFLFNFVLVHCLLQFLAINHETKCINYHEAIIVMGGHIDLISSYICYADLPPAKYEQYESWFTYAHFLSYILRSFWSWKSWAFFVSLIIYYTTSMMVLCFFSAINV